MVYVDQRHPHCLGANIYHHPGCLVGQWSACQRHLVWINSQASFAMNTQRNFTLLPSGAVIILICFVLLALAFGLIIPPLENLDELEHVGVIRYIAETGRLPVHGTPEAEVYHYRQEASQPPLYHLLSAGLVRLLGLRADDQATLVRFNPRVMCGPGGAGLYDNRAIFYHNPHREAFPWQGTLLMVHVLRAWSTALQTITVACTCALGRRAFPGRPAVALLGMAVVAFNPQFLLVASGVNNDNLATPLVALGLYWLAVIWQEGLTTRRAIGLGIIAGLAGLAKLSGWLLVALAGLVTLALLVRAKKHRLTTAMTATLIPVIALAIAGWWFWRNWQLYHDLTALQPMLELVGARDGSLMYPLRESGLMFLSFWGQIPCSLYPDAFYAFYGGLTLLAVGGLAWGGRRLTSPERELTGWLAVWCLMIWVGWMRWDSMTPAPGGRLLFLALPAAAVLMGLGLSTLCANCLKGWVQKMVVVVLALSALWTAARILPGFFAPPPRYATVEPDRPLHASWDDNIELLGYDLAVSDAQPVTLDLRLYWRAAAPIADDYILAIQLISPVPGDTRVRWNYNSWPGRGNYPTSAWPPGPIIADRYRFTLPGIDEWLTQAWDLTLSLYSELGPLPVQVEGVPAGDRLTLKRLRIAGQQPLCPSKEQRSPLAVFDNAIALTQAQVIPDQAETRIVLCWQSIEPLTADYTVFVHLYDESGTLIVSDDGQPMKGAFSTSLWKRGDVVLDMHQIPVSLETTGGRMAVGLYDLATGTRLPAYTEGKRLPDDAVPIGPAAP